MPPRRTRNALPRITLPGQRERAVLPGATLLDEQASRALVGAMDVAPATPVPGAPASILDATSTTLANQEALGGLHDLGLVNVIELEQRIGLLARIIIEAAMREPTSLRDRAEIAVRAIQVLENARSTAPEWREALVKKAPPRAIEAYRAERTRVEERLKSILLRKKEVQVARAEEALRAIGAKEADSGDTKEALDTLPSTGSVDIN